MIDNVGMLKTLSDITKISLYCVDSKSVNVTNNIRTILYDTLNKCENVYFNDVLHPQLQMSWAQEKSLLTHILIFIYINVATLPIGQFIVQAGATRVH